MKKILGLDLGTTSIGWAYVHEAENDNETSSIVRMGVRIVPVSADEETDFSKGRSISTNAERTQKRGMRRSLQRFKLRREDLLETFREEGLISDRFQYAEDGKGSKLSLYALRAKAATEKITLQELVRVLLMINKKRGYKSNRKAVVAEDGHAIDAMDIAGELHEKDLTPGQWVHRRLVEGNRYIPDFYRSDLQAELERVIGFQQRFYPDTINDDLVDKLRGKNRTQTSAYFTQQLKIALAENKGKSHERTAVHYAWRAKAASERLSQEELAYILTEINNQINRSSGYLGEISDRSKHLHFNKQTIGQYLYLQLKTNPGARIKGQVFYRKDYEDEFETIWKTQAQYHPELNDKLKRRVRKKVIFYQRPLKSKKGLISKCEFELHHRVIPKSSPLFQAFRIWQNINHIEVEKIGEKSKKKKSKEKLNAEQKALLAQRLQYTDRLKDKDVLRHLGLSPKDYTINFKEIQGNRTHSDLYKAFETILKQEGNDDLAFAKMPPEKVKAVTRDIFEPLGIDIGVLDFDADVTDPEALFKQPYYRLWHLLYSVDEDGEALKTKLCDTFGFRPEHTAPLLRVALQEEYGGLSAKAIRKLLPHLKKGLRYDEACEAVGYNHSHSRTEEENETRPLDERLTLLKKSELRNPVVEKVVNQMVNLVNAVMEDPDMGRPDEVRIELLREIKATQQQREKMTEHINRATKRHETIRETLKNDFNVSSPNRNDIIRYKLWEETGGLSIYTGNTIPASEVFSGSCDIDHIIPQARLFDDSFSNKVLCERRFNERKSNDTAYSYIESLGADTFKQYTDITADLYKRQKISYSKYKKLMTPNDDIPDDFINRQLSESQYITRKAKEKLENVCRDVTVTIGMITDRLRQDWELEDALRELNWDKYHRQGLTTVHNGKNGRRIPRIVDWTKRNDHRHHAMDALAVAFTRKAFIQYLNHLNARGQGNELAKTVEGIEEKYLAPYKDHRRIVPPIKNFRQEALRHLEGILVSHKTKNKVTTYNVNRIRASGEKKTQRVQTPRGPLHKETIYGSALYYDADMEKVGTKFTEETIGKVAKKKYREALLARLKQYDGDPKKAFGGKHAPSKDPIYIDAEKKYTVPEKVKLVEQKRRYTIRKEITPDNFKTEKNIDKALDGRVRRLLKARLQQYGGDAKKAFANLEENPIWLNKEKGVMLKRVAIRGVTHAEALRQQKDHHGRAITNDKGEPIPVDFVSTGNNHHVAIYRDREGRLQEDVVSFYEAVARKKSGRPVVQKEHPEGWQLLFTMKQNELFVFPDKATDFDPNETDLLDPKNYDRISPHLFRIQKLATLNYWFRHHLETAVDKNSKALKNITYKCISSLSHLEGVVKVRVDCLGRIVHVGEY